MAQRQKKFIQPRFWIMLCILLIIVFGFSLSVQYIRLRTQAQTLANLEAEYQTLMNEMSEKAAELEFMQTDEYIEQAARELGMLPPDEIRYVPNGQ